jgi:tRNA nucleotidyltransferase (CCA-adding enzyme)
VELLELMRAAPGAEPALAALTGEPGLYVVGGAVRDALLGRVPRELDFVVAGEAAPVAARAAERLSGRLVVHERFGTATVHAGGIAFDVVSARRERYERPGALPVVETGASLEEDLARRDFAANALAWRPADGTLTEWPGARADVDARVLRALHDRSFQDDPTRLLRLVRYATRLGFAIDPGTDALAAAAVATGATGTVSGGRLGSELRLLLGEPLPAALLALSRHGLGAALLGPAFAPDPDRIGAALALTPADGRPGLAALAASLTRETDRHGLRAALAHLEFDGPARETVVAEAGALGPAAPARRWLDDVRHRRTAVSGDDFVAAGLEGPAVGAALEAAQLAALAGTAPDRESQLRAGLAVARPS